MSFEGAAWNNVCSSDHPVALRSDLGAKGGSEPVPGGLAPGATKRESNRTLENSAALDGYLRKRLKKSDTLSLMRRYTARKMNAPIKKISIIVAPSISGLY